MIPGGVPASVVLCHIEWSMFPDLDHYYFYYFPAFDAAVLVRSSRTFSLIPTCVIYCCSEGVYYPFFSPFLLLPSQEFSSFLINFPPVSHVRVCVVIFVNLVSRSYSSLEIDDQNNAWLARTFCFLSVLHRIVFLIGSDHLRLGSILHYYSLRRRRTLPSAKHPRLP